MKTWIQEEYMPVVQIGLQTLCIIAAGRITASRGWLDPASVCRALNRVVVVACLPALQFWLLAVKTDMRNMEHWRAVGAFMLWTLLVQIGCAAWVLLFEGGKLSRIAVHSMILVANNTGILAPVVLEAALGPPMAVVGMLATIVLYFQQLPVATVLFELDRAGETAGGGKEGGDEAGGGAPVVGSPAGMPGAIPKQSVPRAVKGRGDEELGLLVEGAAGYSDECARAGTTAPSLGGCLLASQGQAPRRTDKRAQLQQQQSQSQQQQQLQEGQQALSFSIATGTAATVSEEVKTSPVKDLYSRQSTEARAGPSPGERVSSQRSLKTGPGTPESDGQRGQRSGMAGRRWGTHMAACTHRTAATAPTGIASGATYAETEPQSSPASTPSSSEDVVHPCSGDCTEAGSYVCTAILTPSANPVRSSSASSPTSDGSPHQALGHSHLYHHRLHKSPGAPQQCSQQLPRSSTSPNGAIRSGVTSPAGAADKSCTHLLVATAAASSVAPQQHSEEHSLRHAAQLVLGNALMWTTGTATAVSMLGLHAVLDPDVPSHVPELGFVEGTLAWLARCSVPISLFSMGLFMASRSDCGLNSGKSLRTLLSYMGVRILVLPWLMVFVNSLLGLDGRLARALMVLTCVPVGSMAFVVSEQYGEGAEAVTLVMQTGLMVMLPHVAAMMALMRWMGLYEDVVTA